MNQDLLDKELSHLREEMRDLKACQVQFVTFSVTGTGVIFGLVSVIESSLRGISYLAPLTILLPCWVIFFDKSKTINRIVGYYRVLERVSYFGYVGFLGWENSLARYRDLERAQPGLISRGTSFFEQLSSDKVRSFAIGLIRLLTLQASPYWTHIYLIFFVLSLLCCYLGWSTGAELEPVVATSGLVLIFAVYNFKILWDLVWGRHSQEYYYTIWKKIIKQGQPLMPL